MRKLKIFATLLLTLSVAMACSTDEFVPVEHHQGLTERSFIVSCAETKASLSNDLKIVWEEGEKMSVYDPIAKKGQEFTITKIDNGKATITGTISAGSYPLSCIYPASVVKSWANANECTYDLPSSQTIASGKKVDPKALICGVFSSSASGPVQMSTLFSLVEFGIERDDVSKVEIYLNATDQSPEKYTVVPSTGCFLEGKYYAFVKSGSYSKGIKSICHTRYDVDVTKSSANSFSVSKGDMISLGVLTDGEEHVKYTLTSGPVKHSNMATYLNSALERLNISSLITYPFSIAVALLIGNSTASMTRYTYTHTSRDLFDNPTTLSASILIPSNAISGGAQVNGIILANHPTITKNSECPSLYLQMEEIMAWKNYIVVMSDYYGFGANSANMQAFINGPFTAIGNMDALKAAISLLNDLGIDYNDTIYEAGYSQGGLVTAATLRYSALNPDCGVEFKKAFVGGGPYDFGYCYDEFITGKWPESSKFVPLSIVSIVETEELGLSYNKLFKGELLANYREWILSKNYTTNEISDKIGSDDLHDFIVEDLINQTGHESEVISSTIAKYNLVKGWSVPSSCEMYLFHSKKDDMIPFENFNKLKSALGEGKNIHYTTTESGGHIASYLEFMREILNTL